VKRIVILFIFIIYFSLYAQPEREGNEHFHSGPKPIYVEAHIVPSDTLNTCYISYKVPYSNLIFIKNNDTFDGGLVFSVEATGQKGVLARESTHDEISLSSYDETNSSDKYLEGLLSFKLGSNETTINPIVELENTDRQVPLRPFKVVADQPEPLVIKANSECENSLGYSIINFENSIPFDDINRQILIPIFDTSINTIKVKISQGDKDILTKKLVKTSQLSVGLKKCKNAIYLVSNPMNNPINIFFLSNFSTLLTEGRVDISILEEDNSLIYKTSLNVNWIDKPLPLMKPKFAYSLLELMESEDVLDEIYDEADSDYENAISLFWEKYDPDKSTKFNQLMYEFYSRAEKAMKEYSAKGNRNRFGGVLTDRAKVFIKYGKPSEVDRYYSDKDEITEIWKYISPKIEFVFVDATGLGNYKLVN